MCNSIRRIRFGLGTTANPEDSESVMCIFSQTGFSQRGWFAPCLMSRVSRKEKKKIHDHLFQLLRVFSKRGLGVITCLV